MSQVRVNKKTTIL